MTDYVERRRAYVSQVRSSFETGADAGEPFDREEPQRGRAGGQLRFLVALLLFCSFLHGMTVEIRFAASLRRK